MRFSSAKLGNSTQNVKFLDQIGLATPHENAAIRVESVSLDQKNEALMI